MKFQYVSLANTDSPFEVEIKNGTVTAEGDLDFKGTLGVSKEVPVGFKSIRLQFSIETDAEQGKLESLLKLTERYCVVYQTLKNGVDLKTSMHTN